MSQTIKKVRVLAAFFALCLAASCLITEGATALAADSGLTAGATDGALTAEELAVQVDSAKAKWVTVNFNVITNLKKLNIKWDWNDLLQDATKAPQNRNLLVAGIVMSEEAELGKVRAEAALSDIGFTDIVSDYYPITTKTKLDVNEPARTFGHKAIKKNGKTYHIVCAVFKGTTTVDDAITDIESVKDGFYKAGESCAKSLATYVNAIPGATKDNTVLFITGHSLGASTANVVGELSGNLAYDSSKFVYSIASPNYKLVVDESKKAPNFRTFTNTEDVVPKVPLKINDIGKIGAEQKYTYSELSNTQKSQFNKVYRYLTGKYYEDDIKTAGTLKNHLCQTYISFALCDLGDKELERYLGMSRENGITVTAKDVTVNSNKKTVLKRSKVLSVKGAQGKVTYSKSYGDAGITVSKTGKVTVKKSVDPGIYRVTIVAKAAGDEFYESKTVNKTVKITVKKPNPITVTPKTAAVNAGEKVTLARIKVLSVWRAKGTVTYTKKSGNTKITIAKKTGKVTVKKGLKAGKRYKVKVAVRAAGNSSYMAKTVTKTFTIRVRA